MGLTRREFLLSAGGLVAGATICPTLAMLGCQKAPMRKLRQKVVILGFDGISPNLLERWAGLGLLPTVNRLMRSGGYKRLATTIPPESPVAWSSFATGCNPGKTGIFGFLRRDTKTYFPKIATTERKPPYFLWGLIPITRPRAICLRRGKAFWKLASEHRIRAVVLEAPISFEPEELEGGFILSGLGVPDLRGTQGTYHYFSTSLPGSVQNTEMGGKHVRLKFNGSIAKASIFGPWNPILEQERRRVDEQIAETDAELGLCNETHQRDDLLRRRSELMKQKQELLAQQPLLSCPILFRREGADQLTIKLPRASARLKAGSWSRFLPVDFSITPLCRIRGIARFFVESIEPETSVYMSPINIDPRDPALPVSYPADFAGRLADRIGLFKTQGWAVDTMALNEGAISDETFLQDACDTFEARRRMLSFAMRELDYNLLFILFSSTDRIQHMFWRLLNRAGPPDPGKPPTRLANPILDFYQRMDATIADVLSRIDPDTTVFVLSDHGFHPFTRGINLNTWLVKNGYMRLASRSGGPREYRLEDLFGGGDFWQNVDWEGTQAYSLGLGQIYINLKGREAHGVVLPGSQYQSLKRQIARGLLALVDSQTGLKPVRTVYNRDNVFWGPMFSEAPDLQVGLLSGYRVSWQSTLGAVPERIFLSNRRKWSGDHCSLDAAITPGVLLSNRPIRSRSASIVDIAPTVLSILGIRPPSGIDGKTLLLG